MPGGVNGDPIPPFPTNVPRPTVKLTGWPAEMSATDDTLRCAMLSAEMRDDKGRFKLLAADILVCAADGRALEAVRTDKGWVIRLSEDGHSISAVAAKHGSRHDHPIPASVFGKMLNGFERFNWQETEDLLKQFLLSPTDPASVAWVREKQP